MVFGDTLDGTVAANTQISKSEKKAASKQVPVYAQAPTHSTETTMNLDCILLGKAMLGLAEVPGHHARLGCRRIQDDGGSGQDLDEAEPCRTTASCSRRPSTGEPVWPTRP